MLTDLRDKYYIFDRFAQGPVLAVYSKRPMDFRIPDGEEEARRRLYAEVEADLGYRFRKVMHCRQTHSDIVHIVREEDLERGLPEGDGMLTDLPGVALEIRTADCQSVFLYDPAHGVVGNIHSGWRGTLAGITARAVRLMVSQYGSRPEEIEAYINPSILRCCFEVEEDVLSLFAGRVDTDRYAEKGRILDGRRKYLLDTAAVNRDDLLAEGLRADHVVLSGICTKCEKETYHSYRGSGQAAGRNGSIICLCGGVPSPTAADGADTLQNTH